MNRTLVMVGKIGPAFGPSINVQIGRLTGHGRPGDPSISRAISDAAQHIPVSEWLAVKPSDGPWGLFQ